MTMGNQETRGRFVWHELMTKDPKAALAFYTQVVGWSTKKWDDTNDYTMVMAGETAIGGVTILTPEAIATGAPPSWLAYIGVPNADATVEQTTRLGGKVLVPAQSVPGVGRFAILQDPQGAAFAVIKGEPSSPLPDETDPRTHEFSWHELLTTDYKAADAFYSALFGWVSKSDFDMGPMGIYHMFGRDRFTYGGMFNKPAEMPAPPHWLHYVQVDDADAAAKRAEQAGGKVINGPMDVPGGDRIAAIVDPQGAAFAVHAKAAKLAASPA
jgi:hypothetical protein